MDELIYFRARSGL